MIDDSKSIRFIFMFFLYSQMLSSSLIIKTLFDINRALSIFNYVI